MASLINEENCGLSDEDSLLAMQEMSAYVDITTEDFKEIYRHAYEHAHAKIAAVPASQDLQKTQIPANANLLEAVRAFFFRSA